MLSLTSLANISVRTIIAWPWPLPVGDSDVTLIAKVEVRETTCGGGASAPCAQEEGHPTPRHTNLVAAVHLPSYSKRTRAFLLSKPLSTLATCVSLITLVELLLYGQQIKIRPIDSLTTQQVHISSQ